VFPATISGSSTRSTFATSESGPLMLARPPVPVHLGYNEYHRRVGRSIPTGAPSSVSVMSKTVEAVFEDGVFKPKQPIDLDDKTDVRLVVQKIGHSEDAISLLETWSTGDEEEQSETWTYLQRVLDEDRLSSRKLFQD
jgi:predicted DNA-binding antitoxin AbrB/MazE fold protein